MATSKFKCVGCKKYFPQSQAINAGVSRYCSNDCAYGRGRIAKKGINRKKSPKRGKGSPIPPAVREEVMQRDGGCRFCGTRTGLHVHHIIYRSQGGKHVPDNLIVLCARHHDLVHSDKSRYMKLCQGVVWMTYLDRRINIPHYERWLGELDE